jgi:hypothetical protein
MTKEQMIYIIVGALISSFARSIFAKYVDPYIPDTKKLISYTKKFFLFIFLYALPILGIIYLLITARVVDKYFVFTIVMGGCILFYNISSILTFYELKLHGVQKDINDTNFEVIRSLNDRIEVLEEAIKELKK